MVLGEKIIKVANPKRFGEFAFIQTKSGNYELRCGAILLGNPKLSSNCIEKEFENWINENEPSIYQLTTKEMQEHSIDYNRLD